MGIGYASISSITSVITGDVAATSQGGVFITDAFYVSDVNANVNSSRVNNFHKLMFNSTVALSRTDVNSSITYSISIYNNYDVDVYYIDTIFEEDLAFYSNNDIDYEIKGINKGDVLHPKSSVTISITFKYKEGIVPSNNVLESYLNFKFLRRYNVKYNYIDGSYQNTIFEGETLDVNFLNSLTEGINVSMNNEILEKNRYQFIDNQHLIIENVEGNIVVSKNCYLSEAIRLSNGLSGTCPRGSAKADGYYEISHQEEAPMFCSAVDDYGISYYYRGNVVNNYVSFAGYTWRIMRINGDGSVRLILNGDIGSSQFNELAEKHSYVGYMTGSNGDSYDSTYTNSNNSTIKTFLDNWYEKNILHKYDNYLSDAYYCSDRTVNDGVHGNLGLFSEGMASYSNSSKNWGVDTGLGYHGTNNTTYYGPWYRIAEGVEKSSLNTDIDGNTNKVNATSYATFKCYQKNDRYTVNDNVVGNAALNYPIATASVDEIIFAGVGYGEKAKTQKTYLNVISSPTSFWTMSPSASYDSFGYGRMTTVGCAYSGVGSISCKDEITESKKIRPVINISSSIFAVGGTGEEASPLILATEIA